MKKKIRFVHSKTLNNLFKKKYKISNTRYHREFFEYMLNIINHVKNVDFYDVFNQLIFVYKNINIELKQIFRVFIIFTIVNEFIKQLKKRKLIWWKLYDKQRHQSNFNIKSMQNQFVKNNTSNINSYRQIIFFSSNFIRFANQSSRLW